MKKVTDMKKHGIVFPAITLFVILLIVLLVIFKPGDRAPEYPEAQPVAVTTLRVEPSSMEDAIELPGKIAPVEDVLIAAEQSGRIISLEAEEGDYVEPGDVLMRIDDRLRKTAKRRAEIAAGNSRRDLARLLDLRGTGAVSQSDLDAVETAAETAETALDEALIHLEDCVLKVPVGGVVEERFVSVGEYVHTGQQAFRIVDDSSVKVVFETPERDVLQLNPDAIYSFAVDAVPGVSFEGRLGFVAARAGEASNTYRCELMVDNTEGLLRGGMIVRVNLVRGYIEDAIILPLNAIVPMKGETVVFVLEDDRAVRRIARISAILDSSAVLASGVSIGEDVILDGNRAVLDGTPVLVIDSWTPAPVEE